MGFYDSVSSENVQETGRNREPHCCTSALLRAASRTLVMDGNLTDEEDAIAVAAMAVPWGSSVWIRSAYSNSKKFF